MKGHSEDGLQLYRFTVIVKTNYTLFLFKGFTYQDIMKSSNFQAKKVLFLKG